jgi:calmodulin-lysine N-methyltransferase
MSKKDLLQFYQEKIDNTGNVQLWPCEEILTLYCLFNENKFKGTRIIELGSGFSGLCSLAVKKNIDIGEIYITDGNSKCVEGLQENVKINFADSKDIFCKVLIWDAKAENNFGVFDFVLISDCLFFKNYHIDLVVTIARLLKPNGECIIVAPPRGDSMDIFLKIADEYFKIEKSTEEIAFIQLTKNENDKYNPFFIRLTLKN